MGKPLPVRLPNGRSRTCLPFVAVGASHVFELKYYYAVPQEEGWHNIGPKDSDGWGWADMQRAVFFLCNKFGFSPLVAIDSFCKALIPSARWILTTFIHLGL